MALFWSHDEDSYSTYDLVVDFEELGEVEYKETKFVTGVSLSSSSPSFLPIFESEELLSQYVRVYSAQAALADAALFKGTTYTNIKDLEMGCKFENALNYTKFKKPLQFNARFCIDPEGEYKL